MIVDISIVAQHQLIYFSNTLFSILSNSIAVKDSTSDDGFLYKLASNANIDEQTPKPDNKCMGKRIDVLPSLLSKVEIKTKKGETTEGRIFTLPASKPLAAARYFPLGKILSTVLQYKEFEIA
mmetsp:Transcript_20097/g.19399  ORF Transcript_20097/g.19399 Transcript_20097/m.19399 type:complete len:123 (+) Transcript_20097:32-400(+)